MSLRTLLNRAVGRQIHEAPADAPMCDAEPGPGSWLNSGDGFPELIEIHRMPCIDAAVTILSFECPCGHAGSRYSCAPHAEPGPSQNCGHCVEQCRHLCLVTITATTPL